jgi:hypothetical protein
MGMPLMVRASAAHVLLNCTSTAQSPAFFDALPHSLIAMLSARSFVKELLSTPYALVVVLKAMAP